MKYFLYLSFFIFLSAFSQETVITLPIEKQFLPVTEFIASDNFGAIYYTKNNDFYKKTSNNLLTYTNISFGEIYAINAFNSLKINLFYKNFNTVVILDNRLAEIYKIDFNQLKDYKNVTHISTGFDNAIWIFNQDNSQLQLYDYKSNTTRVTTLPIIENILDIKSNYNYCWLLTEKNLYCYNYFGSLILKVSATGYDKIEVSNKYIILKKDNALFLLKFKSNKLLPVNLPELLIKQFYLVGETLYIYDGKILHKYQLTTN